MPQTSLWDLGLSSAFTLLSFARTFAFALRGLASGVSTNGCHVATLATLLPGLIFVTANPDVDASGVRKPDTFSMSLHQRQSAAVAVDVRS